MEKELAAIEKLHDEATVRNRVTALNIEIAKVNATVTFAICIPWWRWVNPAIEHALLRASQCTLRARVVLAIAVTLLAAGGV